MTLLSELKRRNVLRVAIAYLAVSWLLIQIVETLFPVFGLSDALIRVAVILLAIGFPLVLIFSWLYELTPEGLKLEKNVDRSGSLVHHTGKKLDRAIIVVLALSLAYFATDKFVLDPARDAEREETVARQARSDALVRSYGEHSIAVLPFVNMSDDASNEYFSDGISEELLNLLSKIPKLRVISRSSSFTFKGKDIDIPAIAAQLNVAHVLEGSVRKAGNQVRITAQLIEARSDTHLWSETYDRALDDIFATQNEIASAVVAQLKVTLLGDVPPAREIDPEAYALYLQGRHLRRQRMPATIDKAQALLQQALSMDPDYAAAWDELGAVYEAQVNLGLRPADEGIPLLRDASDKALAIDPDYALAHAGLGWVALTYDNDLGASARHLNRALQLEPTNIRIFGTAANLSASLGRLDDAIALREFVIAHDPINPSGHSDLALYYSYAGRWDEAIVSLRTALTLSPGLGGAQYQIGRALLLNGEPQAALEAMQLEDTVWRMIGLPIAYHALGRAQESDAALALLVEQYERAAPFNIAYILAYRGEADRAFQWLDKAVRNKDAGLWEIVYEPLFSNIRDDPRWLPFLVRIGKSPEQLAAIEFKVTLPE